MNYCLILTITQCCTGTAHAFVLHKHPDIFYRIIKIMYFVECFPESNSI